MIRTFLAVLFCVSPLFSQDADPAKKAAVLHLISSMHAADLVRKQIEVMAPSIVAMLKNNPNISEQFADEFGRRFLKQMSTDEITNVVAKAYSDHFTLAEIKEMSAFYDSPTGKKVVETQPVIMDEISPKMKDYGEKLGRQVGEDIAKEHPEWIKSGANN